MELAPYTQIHWALKIQCNNVFYKRNMVAAIGHNDTQNVLYSLELKKKETCLISRSIISQNCFMSVCNEST